MRWSSAGRHRPQRLHPCRQTAAERREPLPTLREVFLARGLRRGGRSGSRGGGNKSRLRWPPRAAEPEPCPASARLAAKWEALVTPDLSRSGALFGRDHRTRRTLRLLRYACVLQMQEMAVDAALVVERAHVVEPRTKTAQPRDGVPPRVRVFVAGVRSRAWSRSRRRRLLAGGVDRHRGQRAGLQHHQVRRVPVRGREDPRMVEPDRARRAPSTESRSARCGATCRSAATARAPSAPSSATRSAASAAPALRMRRRRCTSRLFEPEWRRRRRFERTTPRLAMTGAARARRPTRWGLVPKWGVCVVLATCTPRYDTPCELSALLPPGLSRGTHPPPGLPREKGARCDPLSAPRSWRSCWRDLRRLAHGRRDTLA